MRLCDELHVSQQELVDLLRPMFPVISKAAVSLAERKSVSGVQFTTAAANVARAQTGRVKQAAKRTNPYRITLWITEDMRQFLREQATDGNINALLRSVILQAMENGGFYASKI